MAHHQRDDAGWVGMACVVDGFAGGTTCAAGERYVALEKHVERERERERERGGMDGEGEKRGPGGPVQDCEHPSSTPCSSSSDGSNPRQHLQHMESSILTRAKSPPSSATDTMGFMNAQSLLAQQLWGLLAANIHDTSAGRLSQPLRPWRNPATSA